MTALNKSRLLLALPLVLLSLSTSARAGSVSGDIDTGFQNAGLGGGTVTYLAHSQQFTTLASGPNDRTNLSTVSNLNGQTFQFNLPVVQGATISVSKGFLRGSKTYSPVVGFKDRAKPPADVTIQDIASVSGSFQGRATLVPTRGNTTGHVSARGTNTSPNQDTGKAAASAVDPFEVAPGVHSYGQTINLSLQLDFASESGGVTYFALDSRFTDLDTFFDQEDPFGEALWALSVFANGPTDSLSSVDVDFMVNPMARSLGLFNPSLSDMQLEDAVRDALSLNGNLVSLTDFSLFPGGTMLTVRSEDGNIQFGMGVSASIEAAGAAAVPEQGTLALVLVGLGPLARVCGWHRRRHGLPGRRP